MPPQAPSARPRCSGGNRRGEDGQRERHDDRAADALDGARGVEADDRGRERGGRGGSREDRDAEHEHPAAAEAVAERGAGQQQDGEGQRVGVDRPLEAAEARVRGRARITGSAVVTTRLSSVTMKSAKEVIAKVHTSLEFDLTL